MSAVAAESVFAVLASDISDRRCQRCQTFWRWRDAKFPENREGAER